jgi:hypothetical protein
VRAAAQQAEEQVVSRSQSGLTLRLASYAEDGSLTVKTGDPSVGRAAIAARAREFMDAIPELRLCVRAMVTGSGEVNMGRIAIRYCAY